MSSELGLEDQLQKAVAQGNSAWPEFSRNDAALSQFVAERLPLTEGSIDDVVLAFWCLQGEPKALKVFLQGPFLVVRSMINRAGLSGVDAEELEDHLRELLLTTTREREPLLKTFSGRGSLRSWVASVALRQARKKLPHTSQSEQNDGALLEDFANDAEVSHLREATREQFQSAVHAAFGSLSPRERTLLRQHHLDSLTLDELAGLYRVHRATIARWLAAAREAVRANAERELVNRFALEPSRLLGLSRLLASDLHVSLQKLLASAAR